MLFTPLGVSRLTVVTRAFQRLCGIQIIRPQSVWRWGSTRWMSDRADER